MTRNLSRPAAQTALYLMATAILLWTSYLTYSFVAGTLPQLGIVAPILALFVFDLGLIAWALVFLHYAAGAPQVLVALAGAVLDLVGVGLMSAAEIWLGTGQTLASAPEQMGAVALWGVAGWTFANAALVLAFHLLSPDARQAAALRAARDTVKDKALDKLSRSADELGDQVAEELGADLWQGAVRELRDGRAAPRQLTGAPLPIVVHSADLSRIPMNPGTGITGEPATAPTTATPNQNGHGRKSTPGAAAPKANGHGG